MSSNSISSVAYSEDEVVWAKVGGYPWWPGCVNKASKIAGKRTSYTVGFFGEATHSTLDASRLNKFYDNYADHFLEARANSKLMESLSVAQLCLQSNNQDVTIYENVRKTLEEKEDMSSQNGPSKRRRKKIFDEQFKPYSKNKKRLSKKATKALTSTFKKCLEKKRAQIRNQVLQHFNRHQDPSSSLMGVSPQIEEMEQIKVEPQINQNQEIAVRRSEMPCIQRENEVKMEEFCLEWVNFNERAQNGILRFNHLAYQTNPYEFGIIKRENFFSKSEENASNYDKKYKPIRKELEKKTHHVTQASISYEDALMISSARQLLNNRQALIEFLKNTVITSQNVQGLLDLGIVEILEGGIITHEVQDIFNMLHDFIVKKYFRNGVQHKVTCQKQAQRVKQIMENLMKQNQLFLTVDYRIRNGLWLLELLRRCPELPGNAHPMAIAVQIEQAIFAKCKNSERYIGISQWVFKTLEAQLQKGEDGPASVIGMLEMLEKLEKEEY